MKPHDTHAGAHPYAQVPRQTPKRRPPVKRSRRDRLRTRTLYLQRLLKRSAA